jgi:hypothetical protein
MNPSWKEKFLSENQSLKKTITVEGISLQRLLEENFRNENCSLLTIDAEGADLEVMKSGNFEQFPNLRPEWLLLESDPPVTNALKTNSVQYAIEIGYQPWLILSMSTLLRKMA